MNSNGMSSSESKRISFEAAFGSLKMTCPGDAQQACEMNVQPRAPLDLGEDVRVVVMNVVDPGKFFIQLKNEREDCARFMTKLADNYKYPKGDAMELPRKQPRKGEVFASKLNSTSDNVFRVQFISNDDAIYFNGARVIFLDFGYEGEVNMQLLRNLPAEFLEVPPFSIQCSIPGLKNTSRLWAPLEIDTFKQLYLGSDEEEKVLKMRTISVGKDGVHEAQFWLEDQQDLNKSFLSQCPNFYVIHRVDSASTDSGASCADNTGSKSSPVSANSGLAGQNQSDGNQGSQPVDEKDLGSYVGTDEVDVTVQSKDELNVPDMQKICHSLPPVNMTDLVGLNLQAVLTCVNTPWDIYVNLCGKNEMDQESLSNELMIISTEINDLYANIEHETISDQTSLTQGTPVAARFSLDQTFYRAIVTETPSADAQSVSVQFVDYGNCELVSKSDLHLLRAPFGRLQSLALHCAIADVSTKEICEQRLAESTDYLKKYLNQNVNIRVVGLLHLPDECESLLDVEMTVFDPETEEPRSVRLDLLRNDWAQPCVLVEGSEINVGDEQSAGHELAECVAAQEVDEKEAKVEQTEAPTVPVQENYEHQNDDSQNDSVIVQQLTTTAVERYPEHAALEPFQMYKVCLCEIPQTRSPVLTVRMCSEMDLLQSLNAVLNDKLPDKEALPKRPMAIGQRCCVFDDTSGQCYRAQVVHDDGGNSIMMEYVDDGSILDVMAELVFLPADDPLILHTPKMAIKIRIPSLVFDTDTWEQSRSLEIKELVATCDMEILNYQPECEIYDVKFWLEPQKLDLNNVIISRKWAQFIPDTAEDIQTTTEAPGPATEVIVAEEKTEPNETVQTRDFLNIPGLPQMTASPTLGTCLDVCVMEYDDIGVFSVTAADMVDDLEKISDYIKENYSLQDDQKQFVDDPSVGEKLCVAWYVDTFYRAVIIARLSQGTYKVKFIDYGNLETVTVKQMKVMDHELRKYAPTGFLVYANISPQLLATDIYNAFAEDRNASIQIEKMGADLEIPKVTFYRTNEATGERQLLFN